MSDEPLTVPLPGASAPAAAVQPVARLRWIWTAVVVLAILCVATVVLAWKADQRGASLERELVRRQQESAAQVAQALALGKQAQETASDTAAKVALMEARVAEVTVQRGQLEDLVQSLSRSRDDNLLVDLDAAIRVAMQQTAITGSAEPLVATLRQADERLARYNQPRLEGVRRAITRDLDRVKATSVADIGTLVIKIDEAIRMVDELPLVAAGEVSDPGDGQAGAPAAVAEPAASAASASAGWRTWATAAGHYWDSFFGRVWEEIKSLVRVTRVEHPEALLLAPEQSYFVRENLKLRLLNARLALLSRQFDTAQSDLQAALGALDRYFDRRAKRTQLVIELLRQVSGQARQVVVPRPDDTLAAIAAAETVR